MKINQMPSKKMLEDYLDGSSKPVTVYFNTEKGIFERAGDVINNNPELSGPPNPKDN
jgi:hypothetical protein